VVPKGSGTALSRITSSTRVIAVKMPNIAGIKSVNWTNYITSANQIQTDTGYTFFSALPASVAAALRAKVDGKSASVSSASNVADDSVTVASDTVSSSQSASASNLSSVSTAGDVVDASVKDVVEESVTEASGIMPLTSGQTRTIRVVTYNIEADISGYTTARPGLIAPSSGGTLTGGALEGIGEEIVNGDPAQPLDILALNETTSNSTTVQPIVNALNAFYSSHSNPAGYAQSTYQATQNGSNDSGNGPNAVVYNTNTLQLVASVGVGTPGGSGNGEYRQVVRYEFAPAGVTAATNNEFYVYVSHMKSGTGSSNDTYRNEEATIIRNDSATLPSNSRVLYMGDLNSSDSSDPWYRTMIAAGANAAVDPINPSGTTGINWGASTTATNILAALSESSTDLRYRDDYQLISSNVFYGVAGGLAYVPGTYHTFANNGGVAYGGSVTSSTALNNDLNTNGVGLAASQLYTDLSTASDHLPTVADYTIPIGSGTAPSITSFSPTSGPVGTNVVITGTAFTGATAVKFNGTAATSFTVNSDTQITATVPTGATTGPISVTTANGTGTSSTSFTVTAPAPSITSFSPTSGPVGTNVIITGTAFTGATAVKFNGTAATSFTVNSDTQITATVPTGATSGTISVTTANGTGTSSASFTVTTTVAAPSITSFSPTSGAVGTNVTITGTNFTGATAVTFNGTSASFTTNSNVMVTATVPSGATTGPITLTTPSGTATSSANFTVTSSLGGTLNISQVYGGGGNSGATYKNDFIELYNASSAAVNLSTYAVQYASASGSSWSETTLSGTIQPGHYYLIQEAAGSGGTSNLPTPEATGTINMSATAGKVVLTKTQTLLTVDNPVSNTNVVDFVGFGSADAYEGSGAAPAPSNTTSDLRAGNGATNTYNNASDFSTGTPNPRN
jgi:endonuclease/exonuclease/phosphatase family metal-dependent hydrolase